MQLTATLCLLYYYLFSGGTKVVFEGSNLNVTQLPVINIMDQRFQSSLEVSIYTIHSCGCFIIFTVIFCTLVMCIYIW